MLHLTDDDRDYSAYLDYQNECAERSYAAHIAQPVAQPKTCAECPFFEASDRTPNVGSCDLYDEKTLGTDQPNDLCILKCGELVEATSDLWGQHEARPTSRRELPPSNLPRHEGRKFAVPTTGDCAWAVGVIAAIGLGLLGFAPVASAQETYTPPDNGGPISTQGSGTRNTPTQTVRPTFYRGSGR